MREWLLEGGLFCEMAIQSLEDIEREQLFIQYMPAQVSLVRPHPGHLPTVTQEGFYFIFSAKKSHEATFYFLFSKIVLSTMHSFFEHFFGRGRSSRPINWFGIALYCYHHRLNNNKPRKDTVLSICIEALRHVIDSELYSSSSWHPAFQW